MRQKIKNIESDWECHGKVKIIFLSHYVKQDKFKKKIALPLI